MEKVFLSLGSNQGDSIRILKTACDQLQAVLSNIQISRFYKTKPQEFVDQPDFINICISGYASMSPVDFLNAIQSLELTAGREALNQRVNKGPRVLDIDIIFWSDQIIKLPELTIPHPSYRQRAFVLQPLLDILKGKNDPVNGENLEQVLYNLADQGVYCLE